MMLYVEKMMFTKEFIIAKIAFLKYFKQRKAQSMLQQIPEFLQQIRHGFHVCKIYVKYLGGYIIFYLICN